MEAIGVATEEVGFSLYFFTKAVVFIILLVSVNNVNSLIFLEFVGILIFLFWESYVL